MDGRKIAWAWLGLTLGLAAAAAAEPLQVFVAVSPQDTFVRALGGERVEVQVLVPPGRNHEIYEPTPRQMQALSRARIYFQVGMPFENVWIRRMKQNFPGLSIVDTRQGVPLLAPAEGHEKHAGADPHIWLDPKLVQIQAATMSRALAAADPAHAEEYARRLKVFQDDLGRLDSELRGILKPIINWKFMVFHPAWGYFAKAYGLEQIAIEVEGKEPGPRTLAQIIEKARRDRIKVIFVDPAYQTRSAQVIAKAIGARVVKANPMAGDYSDNLRTVARMIAEGQ